MWNGLAWEVLPKDSWAGGQEWIGRWTDEAGERYGENAVVSYWPKGLMLGLSLELVIQ